MRKVHTRIKRHYRINAHQSGAKILRRMKEKFARQLVRKQQQKEPEAKTLATQKQP